LPVIAASCDGIESLIDKKITDAIVCSCLVGYFIALNCKELTFNLLNQWVSMMSMLVVMVSH
jgi:hypothetical protein